MIIKEGSVTLSGVRNIPPPIPPQGPKTTMWPVALIISIAALPLLIIIGIACQAASEQAQDQYYWQNRLNCSSQEARAIVQQIDEVARTYGFSYAETTKRVEHLRTNSFEMGIQEAIDYTRVALDGLRKSGHDMTELIAKIYLPPDVRADMKKELSELDKEMEKLHETE
jgi:hypothetical protein